MDFVSDKNGYLRHEIEPVQVHPVRTHKRRLLHFEGKADIMSSPHSEISCPSWQDEVLTDNDENSPGFYLCLTLENSPGRYGPLPLAQT